MIKTITDLAQWPKTKDAVPIFTCTEDAIFYAQLVFGDEDRRLKLVHFRRSFLYELQVLRSGSSHNLTRVFDLAVKSQFFRECLEELERIEKEDI